MAGRNLTAAAVALMAVLSAAGRPASALEIGRLATAGGVVLSLSGAFVEGDANRVLAAVSHEPVIEVQLASPGGNMKSGIDVGMTLRAAQVATRVVAGRECASACFFAFLGGIRRSVDRTGRLGVHMHSAAGSDAYVGKLREILGERRLSVDDRIRLIVLLNEQLAARTAGLIATYVVRMGVAIEVFDPLFATPHFDIHWLTEQEMQRFNVVNVVG